MDNAEIESFSRLHRNVTNFDQQFTDILQFVRPGVVFV